MKFAVATAAAWMAICSSAAWADEISFPAGPLRRGETVAAIYHLDRPATGTGELQVLWTDAIGRLVERRTLPFKLDHADTISIPLDLRRAVAIGNRLRVHLTLDGRAGDGAPDHRDDNLRVPFLVPRERGWSDYRAIIWQDRTAAQYAAFRDIGVTAAMVHGNVDGGWTDQRLRQTLAPLLQADLQFFVENIATDFYSSYHKWHSDGRPKNVLFRAAKQAYQQNPLGPAALWRDPSLSDPAWLKRVEDRLSLTVQQFHPYQPLFFNLADEAGIADTASFWDFDFSPASLAGMRAWLKTQYASLAALNRQWGSGFTDWDQVMPMSTREAMQRADGNYSAWADFKAWMDVAFASAFRKGAEAVHAVDPMALAALEGGQMPGWGGYDYARLADTVDVMELYDYGDNVEIVRSLNPHVVITSTTFVGRPHEAHRVWRELLRGERGLVFWDEKSQLVDASGRVTPLGRQTAGYVGRITGGIAMLLLASDRQYDPIALVYSPASQRTRWLLDAIPKGDAWSRQGPDESYADNAIRASTRQFTWAIEHQGLQHRYVTTTQIEQGGLQRAGYRVLVLPQDIAMSDAEAEAIGRFVAAGGTLIADGMPGTFDQHSRKRNASPLAPLFAAASARSGGGEAYEFAPKPETDPDFIGELGGLLGRAGVRPVYRLQQADGSTVQDVESYRFDNGGIGILGLLRNPPSTVVAGATAPESEAAGSVTLILPAPAFVYDLLARQPLGRRDKVELSLPRDEPTILAISDTALPAPAITMPTHGRLGDIVSIGLAFAGPSSAAHHVLHIDIVDPGGGIVRNYSGNLSFAGDAGRWLLPLALNDKPGRWHARITDVLSGQTATAGILVQDP